MKNVLFPLLTFAILACGGNSDDHGSFFPNAPANPDNVKLAQLINEFRAEARNCGGASYGAASPLTWNDTLAVVAKKHSEYMYANDKLSHTGANGLLVDERIMAEGYALSFYAENLLKGGATEEEAITAWKNSASHCKNLMDPNIKEFGVGTAGPYWTLVLASH